MLSGYWWSVILGNLVWILAVALIEVGFWWLRRRHAEALERPLTFRHRRVIFPVLIGETLLALVIVPWFVLPATWGSPLPRTTLIGLTVAAGGLVIALFAIWDYLDANDGSPEGGAPDLR